MLTLDPAAVRLTDDDFHYWNEGTHAKAYEKLGAHPDADGTWFTTWAPHADEVHVIGEFNGWKAGVHPLERKGAGLWQVHVPDARPGHHYKFRIRRGDFQADKSDPYAFALEPPAGGGSGIAGLSGIVTDLATYAWQDDDWMADRKGPELLGGPLSVYEVHLGSWRHKVHGESFGYREIAEPLADYVEQMGFTHVELLPVAEHPYYGSWGYQTVGYYAPTFRFGTPQDFMYLVDHLHGRGIGVLLDWVPGHFAADPQGLVFFDGSTLYEYDDPLMRYHPDWGTYVFDYNKPGVRNFLISNALYWLDKYHIDGLRVDAVASMLYRDYSRGHHWSPNQYGGRENLEAIDFLKGFNATVFEHFPTAITIAEESTAWPGVSKPTYDGGLGFLFKWNMGWMNDTLHYMQQDPVHRQYHHDNLTFSMVYAYSEHYVMPLSHDEVVHGKGSLWGKMPGDRWQKASNLRLLYGHLFGHPGKQMLFMGTEFGQPAEWNHDASLSWELLEDELHGGLQQWVRDLNALYREHPSLWNDQPGGFTWIDFEDRAQSIIAYERQGEDDHLVFVFNFTPVPRHNYRIGVPEDGHYREVLNSDAELYGGSGTGNFGVVETAPVPYHGRSASVVLTLPPLSVLVLAKTDTPSDGQAEATATKTTSSKSTKGRTTSAKQGTTKPSRAKKTTPAKKTASKKATSKKAASKVDVKQASTSSKATSPKKAAKKASSGTTTSKEAAPKKTPPKAKTSGSKTSGAKTSGAKATSKKKGGSS